MQRSNLMNMKEDANVEKDEKGPPKKVWVKKDIYM